VLDTKSRQQVEEWPVEGRGTAVAFSPDAAAVAVATNDGLHVHTLNRGGAPGDGAPSTPPDRVLDKDVVVLGIAFDPKDSLLAAADAEGWLRVWDWRTGQEVASERISTGRGRGVAFSANGDLLYSAAEDGTVDKWSVAGRGLVHRGSVTLGAVTAMALADHDHLAIVGTRAGDLDIIDLAHMRTVGPPLTVSTAQIRSISSNGSRMVVSDARGRLHVSYVVGQDDDSVLAALGERVDLGLHDQVCESGAAFDAAAFADEMERFHRHPQACR
jgi:WD40 repeat protein